MLEILFQKNQMFLSKQNPNYNSSRILYSSLGFSAETWKLECKIKFGGCTKMVKVIKTIKDYCYRERLEKLELTNLLIRKNERWSNLNFQNY